MTNRLVTSAITTKTYTGHPIRYLDFQVGLNGCVYDATKVDEKREHLVGRHNRDNCRESSRKLESYCKTITFMKYL